MRVGIPSIWFKRGQTYISLAVRQALVNAGHDVFIYARMGGVKGVACMEQSNEFDVENVTAYPAYNIPPDIFKIWLTKNNIDTVLFNEEQYQKGLAKAAKENGCKVAGYICREFLNPNDLEYYTDYDIVICPTKECFNVASSLGLPAKYIKWGVDLELFKLGNEGVARKDDTIRFFHPAGWGGMGERRGTQYVIESFKKANLGDKAKLLIHMQDHYKSECKDQDNMRLVFGNLKRQDLIKYYQYSDVAILPSKHEGLGLTYLEAQACGLPVIGIDAPPMNEHVIDGKTGFNCKVKRCEQYSKDLKLYVDAAIVDTSDMAQAILTLSQEEVLKDMKENALEHARDNFDWRNNGKELVSVLEKL